jgi:hypothetical protein
MAASVTIADQVANTSRHYRDQASLGDLGHAVNDDLKFALDDLIGFFLGLKMLVNGRAKHEVVMRDMSCSASGNIVHASPGSARLHGDC